MTRCYIAGRITGLPHTQAKEMFDTAKETVYALGYLPISPFDLVPSGDKLTWEQCMIEALQGMLDCDVVYVLKNWKASKGATIEVQLALRLGIPVMFENYSSDSSRAGG